MSTVPPPAPYRGRFAPSPSGPLHFGSLVTALGSFLRARSGRGEWLVRMEDLDRPREVPGAADGILRTLEAFGLLWDGEVVYQSGRGEHYRAALEALRATGAVYPCACSRKDILAVQRALNKAASVYPGTCRPGLPPGRRGRAWRVRTEGVEIAFDDALQGPYRERLDQATGDFVVKRADGLFAYQLAVVVDDAAQGISEVVRGCDLLDNTPRQIHLQRLLGVPTPAYLHLPVALDAAGRKLSKQTFAHPVRADRPQLELVAALAFLGQRVPAELHRAGAGEILRWAIGAWDLERVARRRGMRAVSEPPLPDGRRTRV